MSEQTALTPDQTAQLDEIRKALAILCDTAEPEWDQSNEKVCWELRLLDGRGTRSGFFQDLEAMAYHALVADEEGYASYFGINPRNESCMARTVLCGKTRKWNKPRQHNTVDIGLASGEEEVARRVWLPLDIDPVRPKEARGECATDSEKKAAGAVFARAVRYLQTQGWPNPALVVDSGNGYHAYFRIAEPTDDGELVKNVLVALAEKFDTEEAKIDTQVGDAPRIMRLPGTTNRKGQNTAERPHRLAKVLIKSEKWQVVSGAALAVVATDQKRKPRPNSIAKKTVPKTAPKKNGQKNGQAPKTAVGQVPKTAVNQARAWMLEQPPAVEGENGSNDCFAVACGLVRDFALQLDDAKLLLEEYNERCEPPWSDKELDHKLADAQEKAEEEPDRLGWRLLEDEDGEGRERVGSVFTSLVILARNNSELWVTQHREPFATIERDEHKENWPLGSIQYGDWLCDLYEDCGLGIVKPSDLENAQKSLGRDARKTRVRHKTQVVTVHGFYMVL